MNANQTLTLAVGSEPSSTGTQGIMAGSRTGRARSLARRVRRFLLALVLALATTTGLGAPQASAWTSPAATGSYGGVTPSTVHAFSQYCKFPTALYGSKVAHLSVGGPRATRSNAWSGVQRVEYTFTIQRAVNGAWVTVYQSPVQSANVAPGSYVDFNSAVVRVADPNAYTSSYYHVNFAITWKDSYLRLLGVRGFSYAHAGDYTCSIACTRGPGWVDV